MTDWPDDFTEGERLLFGARDDAYNMALRCRKLCEMNPPDFPDAIKDAVNTLMTEFWDQGFSQTEIRDAFLEAVADMNRYAAGEERRGSSITPDE